LLSAPATVVGPSACRGRKRELIVADFVGGLSGREVQGAALVLGRFPAAGRNPTKRTYKVSLKYPLLWNSAPPFIACGARIRAFRGAAL
jgi:hypothetical protein